MERPRLRHTADTLLEPPRLSSKSRTALEHVASRHDDTLHRVAPKLVAEHPFVAVAEQDHVRARAGGESAAIRETEQLCRAARAGADGLRGTQAKLAHAECDH